ncbi:MAG: flagellin, partial [Oscillospiraceae bacterium]|nr:flagellin [Oscillospiraceae bacterium]MDY2862631.1 flagellin [Oscillospiraceae bacterium]
MVVQHNISAMNANRLFGVNNSGLAKSLEKLSSGYAINRAGDNAAGLAVSEKMRAQISGLTQASKNAEDGISMVQTFEGALQETDSILQRMRTLAVQSANGTYQNDVDREAIQLEFDQLNDELNQIADTDFNGVVVLNGGQMADGLKQIDGEFNYGNGTRDPKQLSAGDVNKVDFQLFDDIDTSKGQTKADTVWNKLNTTWDRSATGTNAGPDSVDLTFEYDSSTKKWSCTNATNGADSAKIAVTTDTTNGGFAFKADNVDVANVVLNQTDLQNGDTLTLTLSNPYAARTAPTNQGANMIDSTGFKEGSDATATKLANANLTTAINGANVTDAKMNETINAIFDALDGATVEMTYTKTNATAAGDIKLTFNDANKTSYTGETTGTKVTLADGKTNVFLKATADGVITVSTAKSDGTKGDDLFTITPTKSAATDDSAGKITYKLGIENNQYDTSVSPKVTVKEVEDGSVSKSNSNDASTATMTYTDNITLQTGARTKDSVNFTFKYASRGLGTLEADLDCSARGLGTDKLSLATQEDANKAIDKIDNAINKVSMVRASFGAMQNRLEHKIANLDTNNENLTAAESRIRDTDMAKEMTNFTKNQILSQASQAMLAQANQLPQGVLQLLG